MTRVLHLMRHDLRQHWRLLLAWAALVIAHPVIATQFSSPAAWLAAGGVSASLALLVIGARLTLAAVLATRLVQEDAPWSDRAFWRTRPISPATMAAAKLVAGAAWLLLLPALVVLVVALLADVPAGRLPAVMRQVLAIDGALLGVVLVAATVTRHASTALLTTLLTVFVAILTFSVAAKATTASFDHTGQALMGADPFTAFPTLMVVCAVSTWTLAALAFGGPRRQTAMLSAAGTAAVALLVVWYVPAARIHGREQVPAPPPLTLQLSATAVQAVLLPQGGRVALLTTFQTMGTPTEDVQDVWQIQGRLHDGTRALAARRSSDTNMAPRDGETPRALLAVMDRSALEALSGSRLRFRGRFALEARQSRMRARHPFGRDLRVDEPRAVFRGTATPDESVAVARGALTLVTDSPTAGGRLDFFLRDVTTRQRVGPLFVWHERSALSYMLLLPTLAHPFTWEAVELRLGGPKAAGFDIRRAELEVHESTRSVRLETDAALEFAVPGVLAPLATAGAQP